MKFAIIGTNGRLGAALAREYARDFEVTSFERRQLDLAQLERVRSILSEAKFDLLINCAALTNVDYCESHREEAFLVNADAPRLLAEIELTASEARYLEVAGVLTPKSCTEPPICADDCDVHLL